MIPLWSAFDPIAGWPRVLVLRKWLMLLLFLSIGSAVSGAAVAAHVDRAPAVVKKLEQGGEIGKLSEREISESVEQARRVSMVAGAATGLFGVPLTAFALMLLFRFVSWVLGLRLSFGSAWLIAVSGMVPMGVLAVVRLLAVLNQDVLSVAQAEQLVPSAASAWLTVEAGWLQRSLPSLEFFSLWSVVLWGVGFGIATDWPKARSVALALGVFVLLTAAGQGAAGFAAQTWGGGR